MKASDNGSSRRERRHFSAGQKAAIVKAHLVDKVPVSDLCERHAITPAWEHGRAAASCPELERRQPVRQRRTQRSRGRAFVGGRSALVRVVAAKQTVSVPRTASFF
jgi:hypothetical protein